MKKLFLILSIAICGIANAQPLNFQWVKSAGGNNNDYGQYTSSICKDVFGNEYIIGYYEGTLITLDSITLTSANGGYDFFVAKYDSTGKILWAKSFGSNKMDFVGGITTDANGNIFFTGAYQGNTITFGSFTLTNTMSNLSEDLFIVKCDSSGNVIWATSAIGNGGDGPRAMSSDINGNIYITGTFYSTSLAFGSIVLTNSNSGNNDIFCAKYDGSGNPIWAKDVGGTGSDFGFSITIDGNYNVYISGKFYSPSIVFGSTTLTKGTGSGDILILKFDSLGNPLWATSAAGNASNDDAGYGITTDQNQNVYITGIFYSSPLSFGSTTLLNHGGSDFFIAKYDNTGNIKWAKNAGGSTYDFGQGITSDVNGNVFVTGAFGSASIIFDNDTLNNIDVSGSTSDIFIVKYNTIGNVVWAKRAGGSNNDEGKSICNNNGDLFLMGDFYSPTISFNNATINNNGLLDIFITKLSSIVSGINELSSNDFFTNIFPNPFSTQTTLQTDNFLYNATLTVDNCFGQTVKQFVIRNSDSFVIRRDNLPSGLYFIRLTEDSKVIATKKLLITD